MLETQFNDDDANKAAAQFQAVLGRVPDLAGVFGANLFSAGGAANGAKQAGVAGKVKMAGFDAPESIVAQLKDGTFELTIAQHPAEIGYFGLHGRLCPCHRQSGSDRDRHRLHGDDGRQHRRSERQQVPLQERVAFPPSQADRRPEAGRRPAALVFRDSHGRTRNADLSRHRAVTPAAPLDHHADRRDAGVAVPAFC